MRPSLHRRDSRGAALVAALCAVVGLGCDAEPDDGMPEPSAMEDSGAAPEPETFLELGHLDDDRVFSRYQPGETMEIHRGIQGGYHIFVDGRLRGEPLADAGLVTMRVVYADSGEEITTIQHLREPERTDDEGNPTLPEMIVILPDPQAVDGVEVDIEATLALDEMPVGGDEVRLHLVLAE
ncbi:MAG: hypothetical protein K0V04_14745 [Deltaproteobacteria bacterium]|nr:hypothetical protein [Deltaproteobacteria bacterium]